MRDFIEFLVKQIVNAPEKVNVYHVAADNADEYHITVDSEDMGLIIGKEGKTIRSIRAIAKAKAIKDDVFIRIEIDEPEGSTNSNNTETEDVSEDELDTDAQD